MTNPLADTIRAMDGARIPGGCDDCNAYQTVHADYHGPGAHAVLVSHDDDCPTLARMSANRAQRRAAQRRRRRA